MSIRCEKCLALFAYLLAFLVFLLACFSCFFTCLLHLPSLQLPLLSLFPLLSASLFTVSLGCFPLSALLHRGLLPFVHSRLIFTMVCCPFFPSDASEKHVFQEIAVETRRFFKNNRTIFRAFARKGIYLRWKLTKV